MIRYYSGKILRLGCGHNYGLPCLFQGLKQLRNFLINLIFKNPFFLIIFPVELNSPAALLLRKAAVPLKLLLQRWPDKAAETVWVTYFYPTFFQGIFYAVYNPRAGIGQGPIQVKQNCFNFHMSSYLISDYFAYLHIFCSCLKQLQKRSSKGTVPFLKFSDFIVFFILGFYDFADYYVISEIVVYFYVDSVV